MKDFLNIKSLERREVTDLLALAYELKEKNRRGDTYTPLLGKSVILSFPPTSLRTRVSFEVALSQLGAHAFNLPIEFEAKDTVEDKVGHLNCWIDYLVIREPKQALIEKIASIAEFSVVNAMSRESHPCEILGDLQAIQELKGKLNELKFVFVGARGNICNTWFEAAGKLDLNLTLVCPEGYEIATELYSYAKNNSKGEILITNDIETGVRGANVILTDGLPVNSENKTEYNKFMPYTVNLEMLKYAHKDCIVNPCPPSVRGNEIAAEIFESRHFIGYRAKENLLHMQKAILTTLSK